MGGWGAQSFSAAPIIASTRLRPASRPSPGDCGDAMRRNAAARAATASRRVDGSVSQVRATEDCYSTIGSTATQRGARADLMLEAEDALERGDLVLVDLAVAVGVDVVAEGLENVPREHEPDLVRRVEHDGEDGCEHAEVEHLSRWRGTSGLNASTTATVS